MERLLFIEQIEQKFAINRIVALLGPRQCGKTTIAKQYQKKQPHFPKANYFDLENPVDLERLSSPRLAFQDLNGLIIIDEIQRRPELFPTLRYIHDEFPEKHFLILGSASKELIRQTSESLAGRISYIEVTPFIAQEISIDNNDLRNLWLRGGLPKSFLSDTNENSYKWRQDYIRTYIEQDLQALGLKIHSENIRRFWQMLAHYHAQIFNASAIAGSLGLTAPTIRHYLDLLSATFMVRILQPYYSNIKKRQVKSPKIYFRDSGILHNFINIQDYDSLLTSPRLGSSWEGLALEQIIQSITSDMVEYYFWSTYNNAELDLLAMRGSKKIGFEFKYTDAPNLTPSMRIAIEDLKLDKLIVIYPGDIDYQLTPKIRVAGLKGLLEELKNHKQVI